MAAKRESSSSPVLMRTAIALFLLSVASAGSHGAEPAPKLSLSTAKALAAGRAPEVDTGTLLAFAQNESGLIPTAIHDDTTGNTFFPPSTAAAFALATDLLKQGHSLDLGLMQVNSANLAWTGLTVTTAFDPGESLRAGAQVLVAAYQQCRHGGQVEPQTALRCAASVYNTGTEQAGILNGYQARVWKAAAQIVPAIQVAGTLPPASAEPSSDTVAIPRPSSPAMMEDLLHSGPPVPLSSAALEDALPHHGETR